MKFVLKKMTAVVCMAAISTTGTPVVSAASLIPQVLTMAADFPSDLASLAIPETLGTIEEAFLTGGDHTVILIQDAHAVPEAQNNIRKLITYFQKEYGVGSVALEGAAGPLDTFFLRQFPDSALLKKTLRIYHERAELSGVSAAALFDSGSSDYYGIEDWSLYEKGIELYQKAAAREDEILNRVREEQTALRLKKEKKYSPELLAFDAQLQRYREQGENLAETLKMAARILNAHPGSALEALILQVHAADVSAEDLQQEARQALKALRTSLRNLHKEIPASLNGAIQAFETGAMSVAEFAMILEQTAHKEKIPVLFKTELARQVQMQNKLRQIKGTKLYGELEGYLQEVKASLLTTSEQREIDGESRRLDLREKLARLELTREEWEEIKKTQVTRHKSQEETLPAVEFYGNAEKREGAFQVGLGKLLAISQKRSTDHGSQSTVIFVAGGFHSHGLARQLREKNIRYLLLTPKIRELPGKSVYREQMMGNVSWKNYFRVERGRVNLRDAFLRAVRDDLLSHKSQDTGHKPPAFLDALSKRYDPHLLKAWRDSIIRGLADEHRLGDARGYTRFLDEVSDSPNPGSMPDAQHLTLLSRLTAFMAGLKRLESTQQLTEKNVFKLLQSNTAAPALVTHTAQVPAVGGAFANVSMPADFVRGLAGRSVERSEVRAPQSRDDPASKFQYKIIEATKDTAFWQWFDASERAQDRALFNQIVSSGDAGLRDLLEKYPDKIYVKEVVHEHGVYVLDPTDGRTVYLKLAQPFGEITELRIKGSRLRRGPDGQIESYGYEGRGYVPVEVTVKAPGQLLFQRKPVGYKIFGGARLDSTLNEQRVLEHARTAGLGNNVDWPLGTGHYVDAVYQAQAVGFSVIGMRGTDRRFRVLLKSGDDAEDESSRKLSFFLADYEQHYPLLPVNAPAFLNSLGIVLRKYHDKGFYHLYPHFENFGLKADADLSKITPGDIVIRDMGSTSERSQLMALDPQGTIELAAMHRWLDVTKVMRYLRRTDGTLSNLFELQKAFLQGYFGEIDGERAFQDVASVTFYMNMDPFFKEIYYPDEAGEDILDFGQPMYEAYRAFLRKLIVIEEVSEKKNWNTPGRSEARMRGAEDVKKETVAPNRKRSGLKEFGVLVGFPVAALSLGILSTFLTKGIESLAVSTLVIRSFQFALGSLTALAMVSTANFMGQWRMPEIQPSWQRALRFAGIIQIAFIFWFFMKPVLRIALDDFGTGAMIAVDTLLSLVLSRLISYLIFKGEKQSPDEIRKNMRDKFWLGYGMNSAIWTVFNAGIYSIPESWAWTIPIASDTVGFFIGVTFAGYLYRESVKGRMPDIWRGLGMMTPMISGAVAGFYLLSPVFGGTLGVLSGVGLGVLWSLLVARPYVLQIFDKKAEPQTPEQTPPGVKRSEVRGTVEMPSIRVLGGASDRGPGASSYILTVGGKNYLLDAGKGAAEVLLESGVPVEAILLSHAHMDHAGDIPRIFKAARTPIYSLAETASSAQIMLKDGLSFESAQDRANLKKALKESLPYWHALEPESWYQLSADVKILFLPTPHIAGASMIYLATPQGHYVYTGDFSQEALRGSAEFKLLPALSPVSGRQVLFEKVRHLVRALSGHLLKISGLPKLVLRGLRSVYNWATPYFEIDQLWMEATYGSKTRQKKREEREKDFAAAIAPKLEQGAKVLIPVFALGRVVDVVLTIREQQTQGLLSQEAVIYVDGVAAATLEDYIHQLESKPAPTQEDRRQFLLLAGYELGDLEQARESDAAPVIFVSKEMNREIINGVEPGPFFVLAGSGSLAGGKSVQYMEALGTNPNNVIVQVGYQFPGTYGRFLAEGQKIFEIEEFTGHNKPPIKRILKVEAEVMRHDFGAHGDLPELVDLALNIGASHTQLVHGELAAKRNLKAHLEQAGLAGVSIPQNGDSVSLSLSAAKLKARQRLFDQLPAQALPRRKDEKTPLKKSAVTRYPRPEEPHFKKAKTYLITEWLALFRVANNGKHDGLLRKWLNQQSGENPLEDADQEIRREIERRTQGMAKDSPEYLEAVSLYWQDFGEPVDARREQQKLETKSEKDLKNKDHEVAKRQRLIAEFSGNIAKALGAASTVDQAEIEAVLNRFIDQSVIVRGGQREPLRDPLTGRVINLRVAVAIQAYLYPHGIEKNGRAGPQEWRTAWQGLQKEFGTGETERSLRASVAQAPQQEVLGAEEELLRQLTRRVAAALDIPTQNLKSADVRIKIPGGNEEITVPVEYASGENAGALERVGPLIFVQYVQEEDVAQLRAKIGIDSPHILFYPPMDMRWVRSRGRGVPHPEAELVEGPFLTGHTSALAALVTSGAGTHAWQDRVGADFYAGRGLLGLTVLRLGAKKIYLVENDADLIQKAKEVFRVNGYSTLPPAGEVSRIVFVQKPVTKLSRPEDVLPPSALREIQDVIAHAGPAYADLDEWVYRYFKAAPRIENLFMGGYGGGQSHQPVFMAEAPAEPDDPVKATIAITTHLLAGETPFAEHMAAYYFKKQPARSEVRTEKSGQRLASSVKGGNAAQGLMSALEARGVMRSEVRENHNIFEVMWNLTEGHSFKKRVRLYAEQMAALFAQEESKLGRIKNDVLGLRVFTAPEDRAGIFMHALTVGVRFNLKELFDITLSLLKIPVTVEMSHRSFAVVATVFYGLAAVSLPVVLGGLFFYKISEAFLKAWSVMGGSGVEARQFADAVVFYDHDPRLSTITHEIIHWLRYRDYIEADLPMVNVTTSYLLDMGKPNILPGSLFEAEKAEGAAAKNRVVEKLRKNQPVDWEVDVSMTLGHGLGFILQGEDYFMRRAAVSGFIMVPSWIFLRMQVLERADLIHLDEPRNGQILKWIESWSAVLGAIPQVTQVGWAGFLALAPGVQQNLADELPDVTAEDRAKLLQLLETWIKRLQKPEIQKLFESLMRHEAPGSLQEKISVIPPEATRSEVRVGGRGDEIDGTGQTSAHESLEQKKSIFLGLRRFEVFGSLWDMFSDLEVKAGDRVLAVGIGVDFAPLVALALQGAHVDLVQPDLYMDEIKQNELTHDLLRFTFADLMTKWGLNIAPLIDTSKVGNIPNEVTLPEKKYDFVFLPWVLDDPYSEKSPLMDAILPAMKDAGTLLFSASRRARQEGLESFVVEQLIAAGFAVEETRLFRGVHTNSLDVGETFYAIRFKKTRKDEILTPVRSEVRTEKSGQRLASSGQSGQEEWGSNKQLDQATAAAGLVLALETGDVTRSEVRTAVSLTVQIGAAPVVAELQRIYDELAARAVRGETILIAGQRVDAALIRAKGQSIFDRLLANVSEDLMEGHAVAYLVPEDATGVATLARILEKFATRLTQVVLKKESGQKIPPAFLQKIQDLEIQLSFISNFQKPPVLRTNQPYSGLVGSEGAMPETGVADAFIPVVRLDEGREDTDSLIHELELAMQTAIALLVAEKIKKTSDRLSVREQAIALLKTYALFPGFESDIILARGDGIAISGAAMASFLADWAAHQQTQTAA